MKLVSKNNSFNSYLIENYDDLWTLNKFILKGDLIKSKTQRKVAIGSNKTKQVIKTILIELKVTNVRLYVDHINIQGEIQNQTEFTAIGSHHSLSYFTSDIIEIDDSSNRGTKTNYSKELLNSSLNSSKNKVLIIICDVDSIIISRCSLYSIEILLEKSRLGSKKYYFSTSQKSSIDEMYELLKEIQFDEYSAIIFSGPGNYKIQLKEMCLKNNDNLKTYVYNVASVERNSITYIIRQLKLNKVLEHIQEEKVEQKVEQFLEFLHKDPNKVAYGQEEVFNAIKQAQCSTIIILSSTFDTIQEENPEVLLEVEQMGGEIMIVNSQSHYGSIVQGMGNIIAILRF